MDAQTVTATSQAHARAVIERALDALGGLRTLRSIEDMHVVSHASITEIGQSASPAAPYDQRPLETDAYLDFAHRRYTQRLRTEFRGSAPRGSSVTTTDRTGFAVDLRANAVYPMDEAGVTSANASLLRTLPHLLLQSALRRAGSLRSLGQAVWRGQPQEVVDFVDADGTRLTLYVDQRTGRPSKTETLTDAVLDGLGVTERIFDDYRTVDGVLVPFSATVRRGDATLTTVTYARITMNEHPDSTLFARPRDAVEGPLIGRGASPITLTRLGRDVYYVDAIETGTIFFYSAMFVVFDDFVLVVEAPLSPAVSRAIIAKIHEVAPAKPIRYVIPTHYHVDHTGGIPGYVADGATILTTEGNRGFFADLVRVVHPLSTEARASLPRADAIEVFAGRRVLADAHHAVELHAIGPIAHVDEMVLAYVPSEKLVFVSDLFLVSNRGANGPAEPSTVTFLETVERLHLDVQTIAGGHGRIGTIAELRAAVAETKRHPEAR
ncbi:MAG: MBL fold metallo-hydrolase [Gemmatimonadetes bacterium]|nr:MBL fold metallo-hydrolase [Gemmatimonadota bacterium]